MKHHQQQTLNHVGLIPLIHSYKDAMSNVCMSHMKAFACTSKQVINNAPWGNRCIFFQAAWLGFKGSNFSNCNSTKRPHQAQRNVNDTWTEWQEWQGKSGTLVSTLQRNRRPNQTFHECTYEIKMSPAGGKVWLRGVCRELSQLAQRTRQQALGHQVLTLDLQAVLCHKKAVIVKI